MSQENPPKRRWWIYLGGSTLWISILIHVFFGAIAAYIVVEHFSKKHVSFVAAPPPPPSDEVEHKVELAKKNNVESAPPDLKRITTSALSPISLPDVPETPVTDEVTPTTLAGSGDIGEGFGGGNGNGRGDGGGGGPDFGSPNGNGLEGNFFDFTQDQAGTRVTTGPFEPIVASFVKEWKPGAGHDFYESPNQIKTPRIFVPVTPDEKAGAAFQSPESSHAFWLVHYHMRFTSSQTGKYQFVGWGDNVLIVALDGKVVLEASDKQFLHLSFNKRIGDVKLPGKKPNTPIFAGEGFTISADDQHDIDVLIGDEGGVTTSALFIQSDGDNPAFAENGAPKVPLFVVGTLSNEDKKNLEKYLPPECFTSEPLFIEAPASDLGN